MSPKQVVAAAALAAVVALSARPALEAQGGTLTPAYLDKLLAPPAQKAVPVARIVESSSAVKAPTTTASNLKVKIALAAAVIGLAAAGVSLYLTFYSGPGGNTVTIAPKELSDTVPIDSVRRSGDVMIATISDLTWMEKSEFERRQQLEGVVTKMRLHQVKTLLLVNKQNAALGSIVVKGAPVISFVPQRAKK